MSTVVEKIKFFLIRFLHRCFCLFPYVQSSEQHLVAAEGTELKTSSIPGAGLGLFATKPFAQDFEIGEYAGVKLSLIQLLRTPNWSCVMIVGPNLYLDPQHCPEMKTRFINHNFDLAKCNCAYVNREGRIFINTIKPVDTGEELFFDYGEFYWKLHPLSSIHK